MKDRNFRFLSNRKYRKNKFSVLQQGKFTGKVEIKNVGNGKKYFWAIKKQWQRKSLILRHVWIGGFEVQKMLPTRRDWFQRTTRPAFLFAQRETVVALKRVDRVPTFLSIETARPLSAAPVWNHFFSFHRAARSASTYLVWSSKRTWSNDISLGLITVWVK